MATAHHHHHHHGHHTPPSSDHESTIHHQHESTGLRHQHGSTTTPIPSQTDHPTHTPSSSSNNNNNNGHQPPPQPPGPHVRLMCSFGGRIVPRPHDNQLRYVGGETRIVSVNRPVTFSVLLSKLSKLSGMPHSEMSVKYQLPNEDLDALISVTTDEDVENMMEEYHRLASMAGNSAGGGRSNVAAPRLRLFLFPPVGPSVGTTSSTKSHSWFVDALNGRIVTLERGQSEASSVLSSDVPDYLFGLDSRSEDHREGQVKTSPMHVVRSEPESPDAQVGPEINQQKHESPGFSTNLVWRQQQQQPWRQQQQRQQRYVSQAAPVYYVPVPGSHASATPPQSETPTLTRQVVDGGYELPTGSIMLDGGRLIYVPVYDYPTTGIPTTTVGTGAVAAAAADPRINVQGYTQYS